MAAPRQFNDDDVEKALRRNDGMIARAAKTMKVSRQALYKRIQSTPALTEALEEIRAVVLDYAESELFKATRAGKPWAIRFVLTRLGASRGYGKTLEVNATSSIGEVILYLPENGRDLEKCDDDDQEVVAATD